MSYRPIRRVPVLWTDEGANASGRLLSAMLLAVCAHVREIMVDVLSGVFRFGFLHVELGSVGTELLSLIHI